MQNRTTNPVDQYPTARPTNIIAGFVVRDAPADEAERLWNSAVRPDADKATDDAK